MVWNKLNFDEKEIMKLHENGISIIRISKYFNCSITPIRRILRENNIETSLKGKLKSDKQIKKMVETRKKNGSYKSLRKGKKYEELFGKEKTNEWINKQKGTKKEKFKNGELIPWNKGKNYEVDNRILAGEKHPLFNNWASLEPYTQEFNIKLKNKIRKRDNQVCMNCGVHREKLKQALDVHHINYDKSLSVSENLISLCRTCHLRTNINKEYWIDLFQSLLNKRYGYNYLDNQVVINIKPKNIKR